MNPTTMTQEQTPLRREPSPYEVTLAAVETIARAARIATGEAEKEIAIYKMKIIEQDRALQESKTKIAALVTALDETRAALEVATRPIEHQPEKPR